jgi:hypothetical protein
MKTLTFYAILAIFFTSCASTYNEIGGLGMLTDRQIDPKGHYKLIATSIGSSKKAIKNSKAESMKAAIDSTLSKVQGALFLTNVKLYIVKRDYIAVSGDAWGQADEVMTVTNNTKQVTQQVATAGTR